MKSYHESGNVLFYILIAVVLLAALSYAVANSGRGKADIINEERARLIASEIIEYTDIISSAVTQLKLRGCSENEISFENNFTSGYTNINSPANQACHIFNINGGGITPKNPPQEGIPSNPLLTEYRFAGANIVPDVKNFAGELIVIANVSENVCTQANELLGVLPTTPALDTNDFNIVRFTGNYAQSGTINGYDGELQACIESTTGTTANNFFFYKVLLAR
ncbi:MAG: hypothetical protein AB8B83_00885 [Bdellovibrionales bacterium]